MYLHKSILLNSKYKNMKKYLGLIILTGISIAFISCSKYKSCDCEYKNRTTGKVEEMKSETGTGCENVDAKSNDTYEVTCKEAWF